MIENKTFWILTGILCFIPFFPNHSTVWACNLALKLQNYFHAQLRLKFSLLLNVEIIIHGRKV